jgi:very-short-patch-repair endonuclease
MITEARREQIREWGRRGGKARAAMPDFREHQRRAGKRSAEVNDMAALGSLGARAFIRKYGYVRFFRFWRAWRLENPSSYERQMMAILDRLGYQYEREAMVLGEAIPLAVDFYLADANDAVIEVLGRVHFDPRFDHPNKIDTRRGLDLHRIRRLERAGFRVLEIDYTELSNVNRVAVKVAGFLIN